MHALRSECAGRRAPAGSPGRDGPDVEDHAVDGHHHRLPGKLDLGDHVGRGRTEATEERRAERGHERNTTHTQETLADRSIQAPEQRERKRAYTLTGFGAVHVPATLPL